MKKLKLFILLVKALWAGDLNKLHKTATVYTIFSTLEDIAGKYHKKAYVSFNLTINKSETMYRFYCDLPYPNSVTGRNIDLLYIEFEKMVAPRKAEPIETLNTIVEL